MIRAQKPSEKTDALFSDSEHLQGYFYDHDNVQSYRHAINEHHKQLIAKVVHLSRPNHLFRLLKRLGYALTPQLVRSFAWHEDAPLSKTFPTSYLNGLRGVTAIKVFTFHYTFAYGDYAFQPWGADARHYHLLEMPIVRYLYAGFTSHVFFGIAGYLTSLRLFQLLDRNDAVSQSKVLLNISGAMFRRAFRLYLPVCLITFITATYIYLGFYESNRPVILDHGKYFPGEWNEPKPDRFPTYLGQLQFWYREMFDLTNIMTEDTVYPSHDQHLWSILAEMRASLHLYGILVATAQCRKHIRFGVLILLTFLYFLWNHWEIWVYLLGAVVAQADLLLTEREQRKRETLDFGKPPTPPSTPDRHSTEPPPPSNPKPTSKWPTQNLSLKHDAQTQSILRALAFFIAFYFLSYPVDSARGDYSPGYMTLNIIIPAWMVRKDKFYPNIGTGMLLLLLARSDPSRSRWRRILTSPIPQYLGKISFALYLVHGPIMHAIGYLIPHQIWWTFGTEGSQVSDVPWALAIMVGWAVTLTISLGAADIWTREVEGRCVKFVKHLENQAFVTKAS